MTEPTLRQEIEVLYALAEQGVPLDKLIEFIFSMLPRHEAELSAITNSYRLCAADTNYEAAFSLTNGHFSALGREADTDAVITGKEADLYMVFQRKLSPMAALLRGKIKLRGSKAALVKLAAFL